MWKICIDNDEMFSNAEYIFPTQQSDVSKIVKKFSENDSVKRIIIFGSSVTSACNPWSDIDVYVELDKDVRIGKPQTGVPIDLWTNYDVDEHLMYEIDRKGVVVYAR